MNRSQELYAQLAPAYSEYSQARRQYIDAVDSIVIRRAPQVINSYMDVGSGDGRRAAFIAESVGARNVTLVDNSQQMAEQCRTNYPWKVIQESVEDFAPDTQYDLITCLWNVIGHVESYTKRRAALQTLARALRPSGKLYVDVNNRYNIRNYGLSSVLKNILRDVVTGSSKSGDIDFLLYTKQSAIRAWVHLHSPFEFEKLLAASGLRVVQRFVIDYSTGELHKTIFAGQLLYEATN